MAKKDKVTEHHFRIEDAVEVGLEKAVLLYNIRFWLEHAKANKRNIHEGHYWTFNSSRAFALQFPYISQQGIKRRLRELVQSGHLIVGKFNAKGYDQTAWYSMKEYRVSK